jgi:hypothetical protein
MLLNFGVWVLLTLAATKQFAQTAKALSDSNTKDAKEETAEAVEE